MTLVEVTEVSVTEHPELRAWGLDSPQAGLRTDAYGLDVRGWAIGRDRPVESVTLAAGGRTVREVPVDGERPDVAEAHPELPGAAASGFFAPVGTLTLGTRFELDLRARLGDGSEPALARIAGRRAELRTGFEARLAPLLVTTLGRTGSTAVVQLLASHPEVVAYRPFEYEPRVATYWAGVLAALADPAAYRRQLVPNGPAVGSWWLGEEPPFPRRIMDAGLQDWIGGGSIVETAAFCQGRIEGVYAHAAGLAGKADATRFVEKARPDELTALLLELYPQAREVVLVRDFRDMLASILAYNAKRGVEGFGRAGAENDVEYVTGHLAARVSELVDAWRSRSADGGAGRSLLLRYEDLVAAPRETLGALLPALGLGAGDDVLDAMLRNLATPGADVHRTLADPQATIGRWRRDLSPALQEAATGAFGPALRELGYEPAGS